MSTSTRSREPSHFFYHFSYVSPFQPLSSLSRFSERASLCLLLLLRFLCTSRSPPRRRRIGPATARAGEEQQQEEDRLVLLECRRCRRRRRQLPPLPLPLIPTRPLLLPRQQARPASTGARRLRPLGGSRTGISSEDGTR